jgi:hypothetical protein
MALNVTDWEILESPALSPLCKDISYNLLNKATGIQISFVTSKRLAREIILKEAVKRLRERSCKVVSPLGRDIVLQEGR